MKFIKKIINFIKVFIQKRKNRKLLKKQKSQPMGMNYIDFRKETNVLDVDLIDKNVSEKDKKKLRQYSKMIVTFFCVMSAIWVSFSYIFAGYALVVYGNVEVLQDLSKEICVTLIAIFCSYFAKSYLESFSSAKHDLDVMKLEEKINSITEHYNNDDISVG